MWTRLHDAPVEWGTAAGSEASAEALIAAVRAGSCPQCALDYAHDDMLASRWLVSRGPRAHDAPGVVLCPSHTWRVALTALRGQAANGTNETAGLNDLSALYAHALEHLLSNVRLAMTRLERLERSSAARWFQRPRALEPGWFASRPDCPLCAQTARASERDGAGAALERWLAEQSPDTRATVEAQICGSHRVQRMDERTRAQAANAAQARWWLSPGAPSLDLAFIRRLLRERDEPPFTNELCPLCVARLEHERALIAALVTQPTGGETAASDNQSEDLGKATASVDVSMLCARHTALSRSPVQRAEVVGKAPEEPASLIAEALAHDTPGILRARTSDHDCPACAILHAWELARIEGLHRAAGGAPLSETVTARLVWELGHANLRFCAPHLRSLLRFGPAESTWASLGPTVQRELESLRDRLLTGANRMSLIGLAAAALGGLPA